MRVNVGWWWAAVALCCGCGGSGTGTPDAHSIAIDGRVLDASIDASWNDAPPLDAGPTTTSGWTGSSGVLPHELTCVPWTLVNTSSPEVPAITSNQLTVGNDSDGETMFYTHDSTVLTMPTNLVITVDVRYVTGTTQTNSRTGTVIAYSLDNDMKNSLYIGDGEVFLLSAENTRGVTHTAPTSDTVHTYRMEVNTTTNAIEVFRDGTSILTSTAFLSPYDVEEQIVWGELSLFASGTSTWTGVTHNALTSVVCP